MQSKEKHFFLVTMNKQTKHIIISPLAFPKEEVERRRRKKSPEVKKHFLFMAIEAPDSHPRWKPEYDDVSAYSTEDLRKRVEIGQRFLDGNNNYRITAEEIINARKRARENE